MGMTITEKILARSSGRACVGPGEIVLSDVDVACIDDVQVSIMMPRFDQIAGAVWDTHKAIAVADHYLPPSTIDQAEAVNKLREFGANLGLRRVLLNEGIKHELFYSGCMVLPGDVVVATDSHANTVGALGAFATALGPTDMAAIFKEGRIWFRVPETVRIELRGQLPERVAAKDVGLQILGTYGLGFANYKAVEFVGELVQALGIDGRMTLCNLTTEMGAKNGIMEADDKTIAYAEGCRREYEIFHSDSDARYAARYVLDMSKLEPLVAAPHSPANVFPARQLRDTRIHQAFLGTCTNGRYDDLVEAADLLCGRRVHPSVRFLVIPASRAVLNRAIESGLMQTFSEAGAVICNPNCGPCAGLHQGTLAADEVMISTGPRNFRGRGGHMDSMVYLASPATVTASAIRGQIADPRDV